MVPDDRDGGGDDAATRRPAPPPPGTGGRTGGGPAGALGPLRSPPWASVSEGWTWIGAIVLAAAAVILLLAAGAGALQDQAPFPSAGFAAEPSALDLYGAGVAVDGDRALVGVPGRAVDGRGNAGTVLEYTRDGETWFLEAEITPEEPERDAFFGAAVALDGDTALVGAHGVEVDGTDRGGAVVELTRDPDGWSRVVEITRSFPESDDGFGMAVALEDDTALVGAPGTEVVSQAGAGEVVEYARDGSGWTRQEQLIMEVPQVDGAFGSGLALEGNRAFVGAEGAEVDGKPEAGEVHEYAREGGDWTRQRVIRSAFPEEETAFGAGVDVDGSRLLVGAPGTEISGQEGAGEVVTLAWDGADWTEEARTSLAVPEVDGAFGSGLGLEGDRALVGAPGMDASGETSAGAAYGYAWDGDGWARTQELDVSSPGAQEDEPGGSDGSAGFGWWPWLVALVLGLVGLAVVAWVVGGREDRGGPGGGPGQLSYGDATDDDG